MDLDPADADVAPLPLFSLPPTGESGWNDTGGWSDSDDDEGERAGPAGEDGEHGEGEYTGRFHMLTVRTKLDPPSSATRTRMEEWGRPITPFPHKIAPLDLLAAVEEGVEKTADIDVEMIGKEEEEEAEEEDEVRAMSVPLDMDGEGEEEAQHDMAVELDIHEEDAETFLQHSEYEIQHAHEDNVAHEGPSHRPFDFDASFGDTEPSVKGKELPNEGESSYEEEPYYEDTSKEEMEGPSFEENQAQDASLNEHDAIQQSPLSPPPNARVATPGADDEVSEAQSEEAEDEAAFAGDEGHVYTTEPTHNEEDASDSDSEAEEREVRDMSVEYEDKEQFTSPKSFISFLPTTTPGPVFSPPPPIHAPVFSPPPPTTQEHSTLVTEGEHELFRTLSHNSGPTTKTTQATDAPADYSSDDSSDTEVDADVVRITSADPRAAARAAAILKQVRSSTILLVYPTHTSPIARLRLLHQADPEAKECTAQDRCRRRDQQGIAHCKREAATGDPRDGGAG
jgi:hypothetical protein